MIKFYKDPGGTIGYELYLQDGTRVIMGDGYESEDEIIEFFEEVAFAWNDGKAERTYDE